MKTVNLKYAFVLSVEDSKFLVSASSGQISTFESEASKIKTKILVASMKVDERKKFPSPDHGKWHTYCNHQRLVFAVCIPSTYSERLANQFLDVLFFKIIIF
jgi:hypothetical protein